MHQSNVKTPEILLTEDQRKEFIRIPVNLSEWEIAKYYTLSSQDIKVINENRRDYNKIGFALQLCYLRHLGYTYTAITDIPDTILLYVASQLNIEHTVNLDQYGTRKATKIVHIQTIREIYGYTSFTEQDGLILEEYLMSYAMEDDNSIRLIRLAIDYLREQKIILPGITTIEKIVSRISQSAEERVYEIVNSSITSGQRRQLDMLLKSSDELLTTTLAHLKEEPGQSSPNTFLSVIDRLEKLRKLNLNIDLREIHPNRIKQLSRLGSKYEPYAFRRFNESKRYALLAVFLKDLSERLVDFAVEIHDKQINALFSKGRKKQDEIQKRNSKALNKKLNHYIDIDSGLVKSRAEGLDPFHAIESVMSWDNIIRSVEEAKKLTRPKSYDYIDLLHTRYNYLRKYIPALGKHLAFYSTNRSMEPLIEAVGLLKALDQTGKRSVPESAPINFISDRWSKYLYNPDGTINRHYYEMATLSELRSKIRSGDVAVEGSRNYRSFDEYIVPKEEWKIKQPFSNLAVSNPFEEYLKERTDTLETLFGLFHRNIDTLEGVSITENRIHLKKLEKQTPTEAKILSEKLYGMLPQIKLPDLLLEVSSWTGFDRDFIHASSNQAVKGKEKGIAMAALMAMGTNIGLQKMADSTSEISYHQMANAAQWRMYDDAMKRTHYTDTAGYTDQVFGLCQLLGLKFAPRIRDISGLQLFSISKWDAKKYSNIKDIIRRKININVIRENYQDILRLAYSIKEGLVSKSLIMPKLGSYARQNALATALREMGRIEKTIFILE